MFVKVSDGLPFVEIERNFKVEGLVSEVSHRTRKPSYIATREARRRRKVLFAAKERVSQNNPTEIHSEVCNEKL